MPSSAGGAQSISLRQGLFVGVGRWELSWELGGWVQVPNHAEESVDEQSRGFLMQCCVVYIGGVWTLAQAHPSICG